MYRESNHKKKGGIKMSLKDWVSEVIAEVITTEVILGMFLMGILLLIGNKIF